MSTVTKKQIIEMVSNDTEISKKDVQKVIEGFFTSVEGCLANGEKVQLKEIGTFEVRDSKERTARNPRNPQETVQVPACKRPVFKFSNTIKTRLNK